MAGDVRVARTARGALVLSKLTEWGRVVRVSVVTSMAVPILKVRARGQVTDREYIG